jgi:hypothetical protein
MRRELIAGVDAACPVRTICIDAHLIGLGRVDTFKANFSCADGQRIAIDDPRDTGQICRLCKRTGETGYKDRVGFVSAV